MLIKDIPVYKMWQFYVIVFFIIVGVSMMSYAEAIKMIKEE